MGKLKKYWTFIAVVFFLLAIIKFALCILIFGLLISYISIENMRLQRRLSSMGIECTGRILSFEGDRDGDKIPVIEFTPTGGDEIIAKPFVYSSTDLSKILSYKGLIGTEVQITYDPDDPRKFALTEDKGFNSFAISLVLLGSMVFVVVGIAALAGYIKLGH
jgi:uncharacterized protein DUF3592